MLRKITFSQILALWLMLLLTIYAAASKRGNSIEELVLHNPSYMVAEYNRTSFPIYESYNPGSWESMWVHPPVHYTVIGFLMKFMSEEWALNCYYLFLIGALMCSITLLKVNERYKIALLMGVFLFVATKFRWFQNFSFRPEMAVSLAWVSGIFFLEDARQRGWKSSYIVIGVALVLYGVCSHYFAYLSASSIGVYIFLYVAREGIDIYSNAFKAFFITGAVIAFLYLTLFILPDFHNIFSWIAGSQYYNTELSHLHSSWEVLLYHIQKHANDPSVFFRWHLPAGIVACIILMAFRNFRVAGLAFLPYVFALTFLMKGKKIYYGYPEWLIADLSIALVLGEMVWQGIRLFSWNRELKTLLQYSVCLYLMVKSLIIFRDIEDFSIQPHPINVARSISQITTGTSALIGGRHGLWYASGAAKWYNEESGIWKQLPDSLNAYLNGADYFAVYRLNSHESPDWRFEGAYLRHEIALQAVIIGESFCIYSGNGKKRNRAFDFTALSDSVYRFIPDTAGNYLVGSFPVYTIADSSLIASSSLYHSFFETCFSTDSSAPYLVAFAAIPDFAFSRFKLPPIESFRASVHSYSLSEWMKGHPLKKTRIKFYKTQDEAKASHE